MVPPFAARIAYHEHFIFDVIGNSYESHEQQQFGISIDLSDSPLTGIMEWRGIAELTEQQQKKKLLR
ncbi:GH24511 [Drosophila grimshawi]|uniref:GH24511 n=1 Tax=Drosophila grimshawi TaxID=7222 RepID=B4JLS6_DROGR|nr:GH24511 [Drosophila grimshawi]